RTGRPERKAGAIGAWKRAELSRAEIAHPQHHAARCAFRRRERDLATIGRNGRRSDVVVECEGPTGRCRDRESNRTLRLRWTEDERRKKRCSGERGGRDCPRNARRARATPRFRRFLNVNEFPSQIRGALPSII